MAGGIAFGLTRSSGTALALSLGRGETLRYRMHFGIQGTVSRGAATGPVSADVSVDLSWRVVSVDAQGIATIEVSGSDLSGSANGMPVSPGQSVSLKLQIAPDGRIVSGGDLGLATAGASAGGGGIPGTGQFTPLLPDHRVKPGDRWTRSFSQPNPFGTGTLRYVAQNHLVRFDTVGGVQTAVIQTTMSVPLNTTLELRKLAEATGLSGDALGLPLGSNPAISYNGNATTAGTFWMDPRRGRLVKASLTSTVSFTMSFQGFPPSEFPGGAAARFQGTVRIDLDEQR